MQSAEYQPRVAFHTPLPNFRWGLSHLDAHAIINLGGHCPTLVGRG